MSQEELKTFVPKDFQKPFGATLFRRFLKVFAYIPYKVLFWTRIVNKKELRKHRGQPVIFAVNHRSFGDVFAIFLTFPNRKLTFLGREGLFKPRTFLNWFLRSLNGVPIRPTNNLAIIRHSLNVLHKRKESLIIFPEGTRSFDSQDALNIKSGTAMIAMKAGVPVIPIVTNRPSRPFVFNKFRVGTAINPNEYAHKDDFSNALKTSMAGLLDGFEHLPKKQKWDTESVNNARGVTFIDGKLLVIKRVRPGVEYYCFPGGFIDPGETGRETVVREIKEETDVDVSYTRLLYKTEFRSMSTDKSYGGMQAFYLCNYINGEPNTTDAEEYQPGFSEKPGYNGTLAHGTYEPMLIDIDQIGKIDLRPNPIRDQLVRDIKKFKLRLTRPPKYVKQ